MVIGHVKLTRVAALISRTTTFFRAFVEIRSCFGASAIEMNWIPIASVVIPFNLCQVVCVSRKRAVIAFSVCQCGGVRASVRVCVGGGGGAGAGEGGGLRGILHLQRETRTARRA